MEQRAGESVQPDCPFCSPKHDEVLLWRPTCFAMWTGGTLTGSAMVLPRAHRATPFDLTQAEWAATREVLHEVRSIVEKEYQPDGWNVGWNVHPVGGQSIPHAHLHVIPRFRDEPYAGRGIRWWLKSPENHRG